jgi:hypothetical protein
MRIQGASHMRLVYIAILMIVSHSAFAEGAKCTSEPKEKWMSESAMKAKVADLGYTYKIFKTTSGNCYEIYGQDQSGGRVEIYFNPITGEIVEQHKS